MGATSYVIPADVISNVRFLVDKVDAVQLLFFESRDTSRMRHPVDWEELRRIAADHGLVYTLHLPVDIRLGAMDRRLRDKGVEEVLHLYEACASLPMKSLDLHLLPEQGLPPSLWLDNLAASLSRLSEKMGTASFLLAVENTTHASSDIQPLVMEHGLSVCLDWGHGLRYGYSLPWDDAEWLLRTRHIHLHGARDGKDHRALDRAMIPEVRSLGEKLCETAWDGVVTVEVYDWRTLDISLRTLEIAWSDLARGDARQ